MSKLDKAKNVVTILFNVISVVSWIKDKVRARRARKYTQTERDQAEQETKDFLDKTTKNFKEK